MTKTNIVTTALIYANGPLHLGHLVEQIQADIWVRNKRMNGEKCIFISGDDAHGTPIMISAQQKNITPENMIAEILQQHNQDSADFLIDYDYYHSSNCEDNITITHEIYNDLVVQDLIYSKEIEQPYDEAKQMFLPDRFIKGKCPKCGAEDQYGDNCESCGATYSTCDLIEPYSILSNEAPVNKKSEHFFFKLGKQQQQIEQWLKSSPLQKQILNKLKEWLHEELKDWDISRDAPYFGIKIPNTENKYFYVWLDAPIAYIAILKNFCSKNKAGKIEDYWGKNSNSDIYHFIGKDISYFHGLFWPAVLSASKYKLPTAVYAHGFLTVNGKKMSKSKGTFITARKYLDNLNPEYLRYYIATRMSNGVDDIDLNWDEFITKVNTDLIGKVINIASRCSGFIQKHFNGKLATNLDDDEIVKNLITAADEVKNLYENRQYAQATALIMQHADVANQYIAKESPWKKIKEDNMQLKVHEVCTTALNLFKGIMLFLHPIIPETTAKSMEFLNFSDISWNGTKEILLDHKIRPYQHLLKRVESKDIPV